MEDSKNPKTKSEANCLATYEYENFEFLLDMSIWYDIFFAINSINKTLQSKDMHIDVGINQLKNFISFIKNYKKEGFAITMIYIKEIVFEMNGKPKFCDKCIICRKNKYDENTNNEISKSLEESFRIDYFLYIVG